MRVKFVVLLAMFFGLLMVSASLFAHHGTGISYDMHKVVVLKGVVSKFVESNPHSQLYFDVTNDKGDVEHWAAEMRNPRNLSSYGYTQHFLQQKFSPGASITVTGNPSKAGTPVLVFQRLTKRLLRKCQKLLATFRMSQTAMTRRVRRSR